MWHDGMSWDWRQCQCPTSDLSSGQQNPTTNDSDPFFLTPMDQRMRCAGSVFELAIAPCDRTWYNRHDMLTHVHDIRGKLTTVGTIEMAIV